MNAFRQRGQHRRRGLPGQRRRRRSEREVRVSAVAFLRWCRRRGMTGGQISNRLGLRPQTLQRWHRRWKQNRMGLRPRGRPAEHADRELRWSILSLFGLMGVVGLPTLRALFPEVSRGELQELSRRCNAIFRRGRKRWLVHALRWTRAGAVWAMDFTDPPESIDGLYPKLLLVRDLASGYQLLALPCPAATTEIVIKALTALVRWCGVPLVIKCDNDGAFRAHEMKAWAKQHGVKLLFSPEVTPSYNGSIEAGIGSIKTRAHYIAASQDRPGEWTCDDVEAAQGQANETARPRGHLGPTPKESWHARLPIGDADREMFQSSYRKCYAVESSQRGLPWNVNLQHREQAAIDRVAISRALIEHGFLLIRRRRITLPIPRPRAIRIS